MKQEKNVNVSNEEKKNNSLKTAKNIAYIGLFTAVIVVCSFLTIPTTIPFTLQTFAVFLCLGMLGGKRGLTAICCYVLLGAVGVPVFAGFRGGVGVLLGTTGGYIMGFILCGIIYLIAEKLFGKSIFVVTISLIIGAISYFTFGTIWYMIVYMNNTGPVALSTVLGWCVIPFLLPDAIKLTVAVWLSNKLRGKIK